MSDRGIREGMTVYGADGARLGQVASVDSDGFRVRYERAAAASAEEPRVPPDYVAAPPTTDAPPIEREHETYDGALGASDDGRGGKKSPPPK
jgi:hypothetical protein